jgi:hypothetical protein
MKMISAECDYDILVILFMRYKDDSDPISFVCETKTCVKCVIICL